MCDVTIQRAYYNKINAKVWTEDVAQYATSLRLKWKNNEWEDYWLSYRSSYSELPKI